MPQFNTTAVALASVFDRAPGPIYVIDDERRIVFCNRALTEWTGVGAADLIGRQVDYHSRVEPDGAPGVAVGLCPPPAALAGEEASGHVSCMSADGRLLHRRARFVPLATAPEEIGPAGVGVATFVAPVDVEAGDALPPKQGEPSGGELHLRIQQFRARQARRYDLDRLVGSSPVARRTREQVAAAAQLRTCVLIVGPIGSGRGHVARAIHYQSDRTRRAKLVPWSCGLQGADSLRQAFESLAAPAAAGAHTNTLLLEEADTMSAAVQIQLAELLGSGQPSVRIIATARCRLDDLAEQGHFRHDLACALSTMTIQLAPLSDRSEDLPILAQLLLEDSNRGARKQVGGIVPEALDLLAGYSWPGGIDELAAVVRSAHKAATGHEVQPQDLPVRIRQAADLAQHPRRQEEKIVLGELLEKIEHELIRRALARAKGNKTQAARLLGMTRPRLYRRLVQLGLADAPIGSAGDET